MNPKNYVVFHDEEDSDTDKQITYWIWGIVIFCITWSWYFK